AHRGAAVRPEPGVLGRAAWASLLSRSPLGHPAVFGVQQYRSVRGAADTATIADRPGPGADGFGHVVTSSLAFRTGRFAS
ncbi:MAG: hypothetical protein LC808_00145, partial [Actinobacteria bacterium]|nr:hypothetical protein [Actinomycetota bacterium]